LCALGAAIYASAGELGRQMQGRPFGVMHYAGKDKQVFLAPVPIAGGTLLLLSVFGEESSLGLVQLYFQDFQRAVSQVAPQWKGAESALASDFEAELNKNLAAMFGRG
jgi:predicted regulator of Ras-like GTPase activity (Roadblock/LC7/MglB family)